MKVHFKFSRGIDGKIYHKGAHDLDDKLADHWFFKALVKQGDVKVLGAEAAKPSAGLPASPEKALPAAPPATDAQTSKGESDASDDQDDSPDASDSSDEAPKALKAAPAVKPNTSKPSAPQSQRRGA
jgi:hypothetical protein